MNKGFLGTGWGFPPEFNRQEKTVMMVSEEDDIRESLKILILTAPGERIMHPAYGCGLKSMIFEEINESTITEMQDLLERAVLFYEPRIILNGIDIDPDEINDGLLKIRLNYTIKATNSRSNMVFPFYYREGTSLRF